MIKKINSNYIGFFNIIKIMINDLRKFNSWYLLAVYELLQKFKSTKLGIFWIVLNTLIWITILNFLFSFFSNSPTNYFLLYLTLGVIFWNFLNDLIEESTTILLYGQHILLQTSNIINILIFKSVFKHIIILFCNSSIFIFLALYLDIVLNIKIFTFLIFLLFFIFICFSSAYIISIISLRFRDFPNIIKNSLKILFFITPIFWESSILGSKEYYLKFNPLYSIFNTIRNPLLGIEVDSNDIFFTIIFSIIIFIFLIFLLNFSYKKITKWI